MAKMLAVKDGTDNELINAQSDSVGRLNVNSRITDGTDEAEVTPTGRLKVETTLSAIPATLVEYAVEFLENGGNREMDVNGSVTPVIFEWSPPTGETWYIEEIIFVISDRGSSDPQDYGSIGGGLTNGCLLSVQSNGVVKDLATIKDNIEIVQAFADESFSGNGNFMGSANTYKGVMAFKHSFILKASDSDYVRLTVRDNLTGLNNQRVSLRVWREVT